MRKVVVVSSDAMVGEDLEIYKEMPSYKRLFEGGSRVQKVSSIYPTVTFPAHATMMSGFYPGRHGIFSNMQLIPGSDPTPWQWNSDFLKCTDIFKEAKKKGLTTAAVLWPVTAFNSSIDYHIADYWAQGDGDTTLEAFKRAGACDSVMEIIKRHMPLFEGRERIHPYRDDFGMHCAADIIREFAPDLLMVHPANIDDARHKYGVFGPHIKDALRDLDKWMLLIADALEERGILEETDIFLVSDHGQLDVRRNIALNVIFRENGLIDVAEDGSIRDWKAWCLSNGMSAIVFLKDKRDKDLHDRVRSLLDDLLEEGLYGFSRIFEEEEAMKIYSYGGPFSFVLETDGYTAFADSYERPLVKPLDNSDYRFGNATHGYLPEKGPQPLLVAKGPHIKSGIVVEKSHIVNEAPTYASILGFEIPGADGTAIKEILK